ncbi:unnamed protein product, partial [marine sediment metagenome]
MKSISLAILVSILIVALLLLNYGFLGNPQIEESPEFFVGVDVAYADLPAIKGLIDKISSYTNLFVIGSTGISYDEIKLDETCRYLYDQDMYFIIYSHDPRSLQLISDIEKKYGSHFLGVYFNDEQGGKQLDLFEYRWVKEADNYTDAANQFVEGLNLRLNRSFTRNETLPQVVPSDFRL